MGTDRFKRRQCLPPRVRDMCRDTLREPAVLWTARLLGPQVATGILSR